MDRLTGKRLTALGVVLIALAAAAAVFVAVSADPLEVREAGLPDGPSADEHLSRARAAEIKGDVTEALVHYREAVMRRPRIVDRRSPEFLGADFEVKVRTWISELRKGGISAAPAALRDASFLFRRMYGGCG
ncbi:MAG: hypothetical protein HW408_663 [Actinobacteria bacterium]|nr:hypothetical protein [Actinomycetota bacterium]